jgi:hypothetical protein
MLHSVQINERGYAPMDVKERLLTIRILDRMKEKNMNETVKRIGLTDLSHYKEDKKK